MLLSALQQWITKVKHQYSKVNTWNKSITLTYKKYMHIYLYMHIHTIIQWINLPIYIHVYSFVYTTKLNKYWVSVYRRTNYGKVCD